MKALLSDWRVLSVIAILGWGAWGIVSKLALEKLDWRIFLLLSSLIAFPFVFAVGIEPLLKMWAPQTIPRLGQYIFLGTLAVLPVVFVVGLGPFIGMRFGHTPIPFNKYFLYACAAGLGANIATLAFNRALQVGGRANVVVPLTSQYVLVVVLFSTIFLKEPLTWKRIVGVVAAIIAIIFLSL